MLTNCMSRIKDKEGVKMNFRMSQAYPEMKAHLDAISHLHISNVFTEHKDLYFPRHVNVYTMFRKS